MHEDVPKNKSRKKLRPHALGLVDWHSCSSSSIQHVFIDLFSKKLPPAAHPANFEALQNFYLPINGKHPAACLATAVSTTQELKRIKSGSWHNLHQALTEGPGAQSAAGMRNGRHK